MKTMKISKAQVIKAIQNERHLYGDQWVSETRSTPPSNKCRACAVGSVLKAYLAADTSSSTIGIVANSLTNQDRVCVFDKTAEDKAMELLDKGLYLNALSVFFENSFDKHSHRMKSMSDHAKYRRTKKVRTETIAFVKKHFPKFITLALPFWAKPRSSRFLIKNDTLTP